MRIGRKKARFTIRICDNLSNKTKSFVFDNDLKSVDELFNLIKNLLEKYYNYNKRKNKLQRKIKK